VKRVRMVGGEGTEIGTRDWWRGEESMEYAVVATQNGTLPEEPRAGVVVSAAGRGGRSLHTLDSLSEPATSIGAPAVIGFGGDGPNLYEERPKNALVRSEEGSNRDVDWISQSRQQIGAGRAASSPPLASRSISLAGLCWSLGDPPACDVARPGPARVELHAESWSRVVPGSVGDDGQPRRPASSD